MLLISLVYPILSSAPSLYLYCATPLFVWWLNSHQLLLIGVDNLLGPWLFVLSLYLTPLMLASSKDFKSHFLIFWFMSLIGVVSLMFWITSFLLFFVLFEASLIPMLMIIMAWGAQPERVLASLYMLMYTILSSLPFLVVVSYIALQTSLLYSDLPFMCLVFLLTPFLIKLPMYFFHIWLPKAHVEAPVYGSMVLAALLLKIGSYGVFWVSVLVTPYSLMKIGVISFAGGVVCAGIMLSVMDLKSMIAYSSVVHMSAISLSIMSGVLLAFKGALLMSLAHGVCSAGLFYVVTSQYQRLGSRSIMLSKGLLNFYPGLTLMWVLLLLINLSAPPAVTLFSEMWMFSCFISLSKVLSSLIGGLIILVLAYNLILYFSVSHGAQSALLSSSKESLLELVISVIHALWIILGFMMFNTMS